MIKILDISLNRLGVIKNVIECERHEEINGENTLDFEAVLDTKLNTLIDEDAIFELDEDYFDTAFFKKTSNEDNTHTIEAESEHVSYRLNDPLYNVDFFTELGTPTYILGKILETTGFTVATVEFTEQVTYSAQEAKSRRQLLMEFVEYLGGEVVFNKFTVSILQTRGSSEVKPIIKDRNVKVVAKTINKRQQDKDGNPLVSYTCIPIYLGDIYTLGDSVRLIQNDLGINEELRVVSITRDPYDQMKVKFQFSNYTSGLESRLYTIATSSVVKDKVYNGSRIGPEYGFETVRSDLLARTFFRSDGMKFQSGDGSGTFWVDQLYYELDPLTGETRLVFNGEFSVNTKGEIQHTVDATTALAVNPLETAVSALETSLDQTNQQIILKAAQADLNDLGETVQTQSAAIITNSDQISLNFNRVTQVEDDLNTQMEELHSYFNFTPTHLEIGRGGSNLSVTISNDLLAFLDGGVPIASISGQRMEIDKARILSELIIGVHQVKKYNSDITVVQWVGDEG